MRKIFSAGFSLILMLSVLVEQGKCAVVKFTRDSLAASTTIYVLVDRSDTTNFSHNVSGTAYDSFVQQIDVEISSNTTEAKIGYVYDINATSATIKWFDRVNRDSGSSDRESITRVFANTWSPSGLRLSYQGNEFKAVSTADTSITTASKLQIYDASVSRTAVGIGDILLKVTAADTYGKADVLLIYKVK